MPYFLVSHHSDLADTNRFDPVGYTRSLPLARRAAYRTARLSAIHHARTRGIPLPHNPVVKYEDLNEYLDADTLFSYGAVGELGLVVSVTCVTQVAEIEDDGEGAHGLDEEAAEMAGVQHEVGDVAQQQQEVSDVAQQQEGGVPAAQSPVSVIQEQQHQQHDQGQDSDDDDEPIPVPDEEDIPLESED
jgi:hypothetical protein